MVFANGFEKEALLIVPGVLDGCVNERALLVGTDFVVHGFPSKYLIRNEIWKCGTGE